MVAEQRILVCEAIDSETEGGECKNPLCFGSGLLGIVGGGQLTHGTGEKRREYGIRDLKWKKLGIETMGSMKGT